MVFARGMGAPGIDDLAVIARGVAAQLDWQRELGVTGFECLGTEIAPLSPSAAVTVAAPVLPVAQAPRGPERVVPTTVLEDRPAVVERPVAVSPRSPGMVAPVDRTAVLSVIQNEVRACTACGLHATRTQTVFSRGHAYAPIVFVGEGPGHDEDQQGLPFVGRAGQLLDKIIDAMGLARDDVYICNVVKCRPPNNRTPAPDEMSACGGFLVRQIEAMHPMVLVALGKTAASFLLNTTEPMAKIRNRWHTWNKVPLLVTWHPAYLLRQPSAKRDTWDDMKRVLERLGRPVPAGKKP